MRGWPLGRAFLALIALLVLAWPLKQLTTPKEASDQVLVQEDSDAEKVGIHIVFSMPPKHFSVKFLGNEVLAGPDGSTSLEYAKQTTLRFPPEGIDLVASAAFGDESPQQMDIQLVRADGTKQSRSLSGTREIEDVLFFPGKEVRR